MYISLFITFGAIFAGVLALADHTHALQLGTKMVSLQHLHGAVNSTRGFVLCVLEFLLQNGDILLDVGDFGVVVGAELLR